MWGPPYTTVHRNTTGLLRPRAENCASKRGWAPQKQIPNDSKTDYTATPPPPYVVLLLVVGEDDGGVVDRRLHALRDGEVDAVVELPQEPVPVRLVPIMM